MGDRHRDFHSRSDRRHDVRAVGHAPGSILSITDYLGAKLRGLRPAGGGGQRRRCTSASAGRAGHSGGRRWQQRGRRPGPGRKPVRSCRRATERQSRGIPALSDDQETNQLWLALERITHRLRALVGVGVVAVVDDTQPGGQRAQVAYQTIGGSTNVHPSVRVVHPYGFSSNAPAGTNVLTASLSGQRSSTVALACVPADPSTGPSGACRRPLNLAPGETMLWGADGSQVHMSATGIVVNAGSLPITVAASGQSVTITSQQTTINGMTIDASGNVTIPGTLSVAGEISTQTGIDLGGSAYVNP